MRTVGVMLGADLAALAIVGASGCGEEEFTSTAEPVETVPAEAELAEKLPFVVEGISEVRAKCVGEELLSERSETEVRNIARRMHFLSDAEATAVNLALMRCGLKDARRARGLQGGGDADDAGEPGDADEREPSSR